MDKLNLLDDNVEQIEKSIIDTYNAMQIEVGEDALSDADPRTILLKALAYIISSYSALINEQFKQNFIDYATGKNLDALGKLTGTTRLEASKSKCTCKFMRVLNTNQKILIPKGTRVTADSVIYFEVDETFEILESEESKQAICTATQSGKAGNGYKAGSINQIVDNIPYLKSVENITISAGGTDIESDDNYRERIFLAPETFSVAGSKQAYIYHAKSVSTDIINVTVTSPKAGEVKIYLLLKDGRLPEEELIEEVQKKLSSDSVRPLTDKVEVLAPVIKKYNIDIDYYLYQEKDPIAHEKIEQVVQDFNLYQKSQLGRDINPEVLIYELQKIGVKRTVIREPVFTKVEEHEFSLVEVVSVNFKGLENK